VPTAGKYKRILSRRICDRCGVEVTLSKCGARVWVTFEPRGARAHIGSSRRCRRRWVTCSTMTLRDRRARHLLPQLRGIEPGEQEWQERELLDEDRFLELRNQGEDRGRHAFREDIGSPAIRSLLERITWTSGRRAARHRRE